MKYRYPVCIVTVHEKTLLTPVTHVCTSAKVRACLHLCQVPMHSKYINSTLQLIVPDASESESELSTPGKDARPLKQSNTTLTAAVVVSVGSMNTTTVHCEVATHSRCPSCVNASIVPRHPAGRAGSLRRATCVAKATVM